MNLPGKYNEVTAEYKENNVEKEILIKSLKYLPKVFQDKDLFKDASKLLDACLSEEEDVLAQIHQAYCDTLYKISAYQQLSYAAKKELLKEKGFEYVLDLLKHIYEERYNQLPDETKKKITLEKYLEQQTESNLANITMLFNLLYILKGKTLGLELALELVNCPEYIYLTWDIVANYKGEIDSWDDLPLPPEDVEKGDCYTVNLGGDLKTDAIFNGVSWHKCSTYQDFLTPRQPFTAELTIWGMASSSLQARIADFVRSYMLPYIEIKLKFSDSFDAIYAYPSGDRSLLRSYNLVHYYENGELIKHDLDHDVSDASWRYTESTDLPITIGQPLFNGNGFKGKVDLSQSYIEHNGEKHYLYGKTKTIPDFITGDALDSLTDEGTITFDGDYVQAPLQQDYVLVDIETGDQRNPYWENDEFIRDTIIRYNRTLLVGGVHATKTTQEMDSLLIEDFDKYIDDAEVYAGRVTNVQCTNLAGIMLFETSAPDVRQKTGTEDTIHLAYCDGVIDNSKYTGIGDLGILGANEYYIYNGMLFNATTMQQIGGDDTWIDVGATHAVSETYYTPAINNGNLVTIKDDVITPIDEGDWTAVTGYVNEYYTAFGIKAGNLYSINLEGEEITIHLLNEGNWEYITGAYYSDTYQAYGIKDSILYRLGFEITEVKLNGETLSGWDSSFDCISRYHHSNNEYITYGICNGNLYYLQNEEIGLLDSGNWTAICGFYNDNSPRTFAYAIKDGDLYELQGKTIVLKDAGGWKDISGCTTTTNTFILGIKEDNIYKINVKTLTKLSEDGGWTEVFGRYTTSTSKNANCYGFGIKNNKLYVLSTKGEQVTPGRWKVDGKGKPVDLSDYNITDLTVRVNGQEIHGIENITKTVPVGNEDQSNYDIYVDYETIGFEDNTRYQIRTSMSEVYKTYIDPKNCRENVYMDNCPEFNTEDGTIKNFTSCPLILHGKQKINGEGEAYEFEFHQSYLEIPEYYDIQVDEYGQETRTLIPLIEAILNIGFVVEHDMKPIILDEDGNGVYYGYCEGLQRSGLFVKNKDGYTKIVSVAEGDYLELYIKYDNNYSISYSLDGTVYTDVNVSTKCPKYLGGNGTEFGNGIVFLKNSSITTTEKFIPLYENGKYFSVGVLEQDLVERIITNNQECQKVIEIQDENKNKVIELEMDSMYVSRNVDCSNDDLTVTDSYVLNTLNYGETEGTTKSTLVYSGEYTLDPEKAKEVGDLKTSSGYHKTAIMDHFDVEDYIEVTPNATLVIETGDNVENQILFQTEEHTAYTNKYLLTTDMSGTYNADPLTEDKTAENHLVPSGIIFELHTDEPGTTERTLEFNAESFNVNNEKITDWEQFNFDDYMGMLSHFQITDIEELDPNMFYCNINLDLQERSKQGNITQFDVLPELVIRTSDTYKQKIMQLGDEDVIIGNKIAADMDIYQEDTIDPDVYAWEDNTDYKLKFDIQREVIGTQGITVHETASTEEKDKFQWTNGTVSNFSSENYIELPNLTNTYGLVLQYVFNDDISVDQGLFGFQNGQSVCIKDHKFCLYDETGAIKEIAEEDLEDRDTFYLKFVTDEEAPGLLKKAKVYLALDFEDAWEPLFENTITIENNMLIGYANTGVEPMPFNGTMDLTRSYTLNNEKQEDRLYGFKQTTTIYISDDTEKPIVIETLYPVDEVRFGFAFHGSLDLYGSNLLLPYTLEWLENRISINKVIKNEMAEADPTYDPDLDKNVYTIKEYGVHLGITPKRFDSVTVNYETKDNAYYMAPNTRYYLRCDVELDENGKCLLTQVNNPVWNAGVVSSFENGYYTYDFTKEQYIVLHINTTDEDQGICGYLNGGQEICVKDGKIQYFDDTNYHVICDPGDVYLKLYMNSNNIEYYNGEWIKTDIVAGFSGYETFMIGRTDDSVFKGTINLNDSYIVTDEITYLFSLYKRITPYISTNQVTWDPIVIEPMLTIKNMINFGQGFSGKLFLKDSDLLIYDATYWTANQVNIYAMVDIPEDNIHANDLVRTVIRDSYVVDPAKYWTDNEIVKVNPEDLKLHVEGLPNIDDTIELTYESWYLFRESNHEYDFKLTYSGDTVKVSYVDVATGKEYIIYEMPNQNYIVNLGYNFWGTLSVKDSYRGGMMLCDYMEYYRYIIEYRKYGDLDWIKWSEFSRERRYDVYQRTGFDLNGPLYMESSYVKMGNLISPFLAYWDGTYITIVGNVSIENGIASQFTEEDYLLIRENSIVDGDIVSIKVEFDESLVDQGIGTLVYLKNNNITYNNIALQEVYPGYKACIEYHIQDGKVYARFIGDNSSNFKQGKADAHVLTIIPYNKDLQDYDSNYYVKSLEDAQKLKVYYRIGDTHYDHYLPPVLKWYEVQLEKVEELRYFGTTLKDVYVAKVQLGYTYDKAGNATNTNPDKVEYLDNDTVEYKIVGEITTTNQTVLYADRMEKLRTKF